MGAAGIALSGLWLVIAAGIAIFLLWRLGRLILGVVLNTILGFVTFFIVNAVFGLGISWDVASIVITAIFGLPGAAVVIFLKLLGVTV